MTKVALTLIAALVSFGAWTNPSGVIGGIQTPAATLHAAHSSALAAPQTAVARPAGPRAAPQFKVETIAQLLKSAHRTKVSQPSFRGSTPRKAAPSRPARAPVRITQTPKTLTSPLIAVDNGLNQPGLSASEEGSSEAPPDSTGAIGPADYVEIVNSQIAVFSRSSLSLISTSTLHDFIGDTGDTPDPYCDVQVQWDPSSNRWLFSFLFCNESSHLQFVVFGWSKTSDPTNLSADNSNSSSGWCAFGARSDPLLLDYDKLGHNSKYIILGGNFYDETNAPDSNPPFVTAAIAWFAKPANGVTTCPTPTAHNTGNPLLNGDHVTKTFTPVPVNTFTGSGDGYIVSAYDPAGNNGVAPGARTKLAVWHVDSSGVLHQNSDITVLSFTFPEPAPELASTNVIDTLDGRLTQAVGDPATGIWTSHTVDGPGGRSVLRWYEIKVSGTTASLAQQGTIASATDFVFNGAISPRFDHGGAAVFYNRSSASIDPVIAAQERLTTTAAGAMEPGELVLGTSTSPDTDFTCNSGGPGVPCRWGDYSGASPDPVHTNLVWGTNQSLVFDIVAANPAWVTRNFAVVFVGTPSNVTAVAGDRDAYVAWTPAPVDPAAAITSYTIHSYDGFFIHTLTVPFPASSMIFTGLTNGLTYTFTVIANSAVGSSTESAPSNPVTPTRAVVQTSPQPSPSPRDPVDQSSPAPSPIGR